MRLDITLGLASVCPRSMRGAWLCSLVLAPVVGHSSGCIVPKQVGEGRDDQGDQSDDGSTEASTDGPGNTDDGPGSTDDGPHATSGSPGFCDPVDGFECAGPLACEDFDCGGPFNAFDEVGCLRPSCGDSRDCGVGEICFTPLDFGGCASSGIFCTDDDGVCECGGNPDCGGSYCLPEGEAPSEVCLGQPDQASCDAVGCNHFETVTVVTDTCDCITAQPMCVWFLGEIGGAGAPDYFWHPETQTVALFSASWIELPVGWLPCTDPGAPPACDCYEPFTEPMCP